MDPVGINVGGNEYQTTKGNMALAMQQLSRAQKTQAETSRSEYENQSMEIEVGGQPFKIRRHEFEMFSKTLADLERQGMEREESDRAQIEADVVTEGIKELATVETPEDMTAETAAKTGVLSDWLRQKKAGAGSNQKEYLNKLRTSWGKLNVELNSGPDNPLGLAASANSLALELNEPVMSVVFPEGLVVPGWATNISKGDVLKMDKFVNPSTGKSMTAQELKKQADADGMTFNDALKILKTHELLKGKK